MNWQTAMKLLLSRCLKSMKRTVGLFSPVLRFSLTLVFSSSRLKSVAIVLDQAGAGEFGREVLYHLLNLIVFQPRIDHLQLLPAAPEA